MPNFKKIKKLASFLEEAFILVILYAPKYLTIKKGTQMI